MEDKEQEARKIVRAIMKEMQWLLLFVYAVSFGLGLIVGRLYEAHKLRERYAAVDRSWDKITEVSEQQDSIITARYEILDELIQQFNKKTK